MSSAFEAAGEKSPEQVPAQGREKPLVKRAARSILRSMVEISSVPLLGRLSLTLAGFVVGPYKDRTMLASLGSKPYISPRAQVGRRGIHIGPNCFIDDFVTVQVNRGGGSIKLGRRVYIYRGTILENGGGGEITIGDNVHIQSHCNLKGWGRLQIGSNVQIAPHCAFAPYDHNFDDVDMPIYRQGISSKGGIVVEDDVWLGLGVIVLDGVTIGRGAVIGAGSVVTKDIPPYSKAMGVPAKVVGRRGTLEPGLSRGEDLLLDPVNQFGQKSVRAKEVH